MSYFQLFVFTVAAILTLSGSSSAAKPCDANGRCKYGGRCGSDNMCYCSFRCTKPTWDININTLYCKPQKGSRTPELFHNICFLMARACELQEDIPVIKFNLYERRKSKQCQEKNADRWGLCPDPKDFMGPCGGTLNQNSFSPDAGVCLKDKLTQRMRCECPNTKTGGDCQVKFVMSQASTKQKRFTDDPKSKSSDVMPVALSVMSMGGMLIGIIIFLLIRSRLNSKCSNNVERLDKIECDTLYKKETTNEKEEENQNLSSKHCIMEIQSQGNNLPSTKEHCPLNEFTGGQRRHRLKAYKASTVDEDSNSCHHQLNNNNNSKTVGQNPCLYQVGANVGPNASSDGLIYVNSQHSKQPNEYFEGRGEIFPGGACFYTL